MKKSSNNASERSNVIEHSSILPKTSFNIENSDENNYRKGCFSIENEKNSNVFQNCNISNISPNKISLDRRSRIPKLHGNQNKQFKNIKPFHFQNKEAVSNAIVYDTSDENNQLQHTNIGIAKEKEFLPLFDPLKKCETDSVTKRQARFEAYVMTGDLILNISKTSTRNSIGTNITKGENLGDTFSSKPFLKQQSNSYMECNGILAPKASGETTPSSSSSISEGSNTKLSSKINDHESYDVFSKKNSNNIINDGSPVSNMKQKPLSNDNNDDTSACVTFSLSSSNKNEETYIFDEKRKNLDQCILIDSEDKVSSIKLEGKRSSSSSTIKSDVISTPEETSFSVPTSPFSVTPLLDNEDSNSLPNSSEQNAKLVMHRKHIGGIRKCDSSGFRTSKSEDHLQPSLRDGICTSVIPIDIDEDVNSSLNTLLDTQQDSDESQTLYRDRIVWTYNAPVSQGQGQPSMNSQSSSISTSPQHSTECAQSPTSVSSSVMSSNSNSKAACALEAAPIVVIGTNNEQTNNSITSVNSTYYLNTNVGATQSINTNNGTNSLTCLGGDQSVSECVSNISSPDYQDDENLLSSRELMGVSMTDPSDSDSTLLMSDAINRKQKMTEKVSLSKLDKHKLIIQVKNVNTSEGNGNGNFMKKSIKNEFKDSDDEQVLTFEENNPNFMIQGNYEKDLSPPISDDGSDVDSIHSYHYSPKAVDIPSAIRLAKRLYALDGFKRSDVSQHLCKNNDFSRAVAEEYLKYFNFESLPLDEAIRKFLQQLALSGETQERERVLVHFSKRYLDCNPGFFNSQDSVHTLTCAIMLLNTDLHGQNFGTKMTCRDFINNLAELNDGEDFPKDILKYLYHAIKNKPLEWAMDEFESQFQKNINNSNMQSESTSSLEAASSIAIEYKKGYVMKKSCYEANYKKTPFGKRSWKMFFCTLRGLVLYLHKDEHGFRKNQISDSLHSAIRIHHALATKATDYTKKQHVFRLQTSDQSEFLFQTSDSKELLSWIETINFVCANLSAPALEAAVGSQKRFQRPLLPSSQTRLSHIEQLKSHETQIVELEASLNEHKNTPIPSKGLALQNFKEKEIFLNYELKRYKTYVNILNVKSLNEHSIYHNITNYNIGDNNRPSSTMEENAKN